MLADDNSISHAVEEGGTVHDNLREALFFILPTSGLQIVRPDSGHFLAGAQHATMQQVK